MRIRSASSCLLMLLLAVAATHADAGKPKNSATLAPDFVRADLDGRQQRLSDYRGKVILLNFWATWCAPCLIEMPRFSQWQEKLGPRGLQILGISMDDSPDPVMRLARQRRPAYPLIMGDAALAKLYGGVYGLPTSFLIDARGRIVARYRGEVNLQELEARLESLLPAAKP